MPLLQVWFTSCKKLFYLNTVAGQILSAVSPNGSLTVEVGIVISAVITWLITTFGIKIFHHYER